MQEALTTSPQELPVISWKTRLLDICLLVVGLSFIIGLFGYLRPLARPDALAFLETAREMLVNHDWVTPTLNNAITLDYPPLFFWLTALNFKLFGYSLFAARLWPAIFGIIGVVNLYLFGSWWAGRRMGYACALIATSSMLWLTLMTAAAPYIMGSVLLTISLCSIFAAGLTASASHRGWLATLFWTCCGLNTLLLGTAGLVLPLLIAIIHFTVMSNKEGLKSLVSPRGIFIFAILTLPWYFLAAQNNPGFLSFFFYKAVWLDYLAHFHHGLQFLLIIFFATFAALLPWSVLANMGFWACLARSWDARFDKPLGTFLIIWVIVTTVYLIGIAPLSLFWVALLTPALSIALSKALYRWWSTTDQPLFKASRGLLILFIVLLTAFFCLMSRYTSNLAIGFITSPETAKLLVILYVIFLAGGIAAYFTLKRREGLKDTAIVFFCLGLVGTITFVSALPRLRADSMQSIIQYIQTHQKADDVVANYQHYYPEVAFSLQKAPIVMVDSMDMPTYARLNQNTGTWMVTAPFFWQTLQKNGRHVFLIAPASAMSGLAETITANHLNLVAGANGVVLLTNAES
ncbi:MAG: glycosyltransferase family 39 protein [Gammaproteobacteria bacterium]|nr:glycosyltransferase family 39 protein [Gammaproteobacteria bacterium]